jgi:hypothetical protein
MDPGSYFAPKERPNPRIILGITGTFDSYRKESGVLDKTEYFENALLFSVIGHDYEQ